MISIIVPVYNVEKYLERCVNSLLNQTYRDLEIILVDDGSTDASGSICDRYLEKDSRIKVIHKENGGLSDARNVGIDNSFGEYIGFIDSDDYVHEKMFEILYRNLCETEADISVCEFLQVSDYGKYEVDENSEKLSVYQGVEVLQLLNRLDTNEVIVCNKLFRRHIFETYRFIVGKLHEDQWAIHHILYETHKIVFSNLKMYFYFVRQNSISKSDITEKKVFDLIGAFIDACEFFYNKQDETYQKVSAYMAANYVMYFYQEISKSKREDRKILLKQLRKVFHEIMLLNSNVFSWKQLTYQLFAIHPRLGIGFRMLREKII